MAEAWVTPGRFKVPYLQTTWSPSTMTWAINEVNTDPYNYGTLASTSQAYQNINQGIPTGYNQYSGCPAGEIMGPDGVCRKDPNWIGAGTTTPTPTTPPTTPDPTPTQPDYSNQYQGSGKQDSIDHSVWTGNVTGNTYENLPGGFNNWSDETFYDYGLDKGYFTEVGGLGDPMQTTAEGWLGTAGQFMNDKKFNWWLNAAQKRGIFELSYDTEGNLENAKLLKKRGPLENEWGGGMLEEITAKTKDILAENVWKNLMPEPVSEMRTYGERTVDIYEPVDLASLNISSGMFGDLIIDETERQEEWNKTGYYTNNMGKKFGPGSEIGPERVAGLHRVKDWELQKKEIEDRIESGSFDSFKQDQMFDPLLGEWVKKSPSLMAEKERSERAQKLLDKQQAELSKIKPIIKPKPILLIGTAEGNKASNMVTASHGQYIGSSVYKNPGGGHYQQNGKFVSSNGTVQAGGSMSDSIYAMANGTAVDSVLDRTLKDKNSAKVMKAEAFKMKEAGKITEAEYNKIKDYKSKSDYQKDENNKTIHENGTITKGSEKKAPPKKGKGPGRGQQRTGQGRREGGSSGGNTGSGSKKDKIICTEMYRQTTLNDWKEAMKLWYLFQKKYLTPTHQVGYHFLFKPFVRGMKKSRILTAIGSHFAKQRTKDIKHIMFGTKFSLLGRIYRIIFEPICYITGLLLTYKEKLAWQ